MSDDKGPTDRARADSDSRGLPIEVRPREHVSSLEEAAASAGVSASQLVKTLVVRRGADDYVLVLLPGDRSLSWPKLRAAAGANRMSLPDAAEAREATGYERGTVTPLGCVSQWPVFADRTISGRIGIGSGSHSHGVFVDAAALLDAYDATVTDLTS